MRKLVNLTLTIALLGVAPTLVFSQAEQCTQNLEEAQIRYEEGRIQDVEGLLLRCVNTKAYTKGQEVQALRLLILSYIFMEQEDKADTTMLRLLQRNHEFQPDEALDPTEFINLYNTYNTDPIFNVGVQFGQNFSLTQVKQLHSVGQQGWKKEYGIVNGVTLGINFEWEFADQWYLYPQVQYSIKKYTQTEEYQGVWTGTIISTGQIAENLQILEVPISVQYEFGERNFRPYAFVGGSASYLLASSYPSDNNSRTRSETADVKINTVDSRDDRNVWNGHAHLGGGVKLKAGEGFLTAEVRLSYQITDFSKPENSLTPTDDPDLLYNLWTWYDTFTMHSGFITIGYTKNIYRPKKL